MKTRKFDRLYEDYIGNVTEDGDGFTNINKEAIDFIIRTNEIEGYTIDRKDVEQATEGVRQGYPLRYATDNPHIISQFEMLKELGKIDKIDADAVLQLHRAQGDQVLDHGTSGIYRSNAAGSLGGAKYVDHRKIADTMRVWENELPNFDDPFSAVALLMQIHPFADGNGRVGRMVLLKLNNMDFAKTLRDISSGNYITRIQSAVNREYKKLKLDDA